jgi:hypothetical protein
MAVKKMPENYLVIFSGRLFRLKSLKGAWL